MPENDQERQAFEGLQNKLCRRYADQLDKVDTHYWQWFRDALKETWQAARASAAPLPQTLPEDIETLAEFLHIWYLEALFFLERDKRLTPGSFNENARKSYPQLSEEQKFIDRYIAYKVWLRTTPSPPQPSAGQTEGK